jgi:uncharacterized protein (DUF433 family)
MGGTIREHIEVVEGAGGAKARIAGHRIRVQDAVILHEKLGMSPDEIVSDYPTIGPHALAEELRRSMPGPLEEKLKHRREG